MDDCRARAEARVRRDPWDVLNNILQVPRTGAPGKDLPDRYPSYQTL